ncbi:CDC14-domain-containing protein [Trametopsis cervina]|nr:CDC14-domain-containing protein [Trametopsis cervina]
MYMKDVIQDALDDLASNKSSAARQGRALDSLERLLAEICVTADTSSSEALQSFVSLQDTFQCNVPFRLLSWISKSLSNLHALASKSLTTNHDPELTTLSSQVAQALSIIQGTALIHGGSKHYLGRRYPLEVLVELFYIARRVPSIPNHISMNLSGPSPTAVSNNTKDKASSSIPLANVVLDTLLCILVDAPSALRVFEDVNGVQTLVKMFKRAATPREVRMRCIEFLYFYLMDESPLGRPSLEDEFQSHSDSSSSDQVPTAPNSPVHSSHHRSALSVSQSSDSSVSSIDSSSTASTTASSSTRATSVSSRRSSVSISAGHSPVSPLAPSPMILEKPRHTRSGSMQPRSVSMLKDGDFQPFSPRKAHIAKLGVGTPRSASRLRTKPVDVHTPFAEDIEQDSSSTSTLSSKSEDAQTPRQTVQRVQTTSLGQLGTPSTPNAAGLRGHRRAQSSIEVGMASPVVRSPPASPNGSKEVGRLAPAKSGMRTMQEKKAFLATMLTNVDALVEGIQRAGVLGLA